MYSVVLWCYQPTSGGMSLNDSRDAGARAGAHCASNKDQVHQRILDCFSWSVALPGAIHVRVILLVSASWRMKGRREAQTESPC
jgi:hypothetical protein